MKRVIIIVFLLWFSDSHAQVVKSVVLDSVMIEAVKKGFDVKDFIDMVEMDTSFLRGFRNLRNLPHDIESDFIVYNRNRKKVKAKRYVTANQVSNRKKRWIVINSETVKGKFYKRNKEPVVYTAELFDDVFLYKDTLNVVPLNQSSSYQGDKNKGDNIAKLKKLIFSPGTDIDGVPLVGKRMAIFSDEMAPYYDYNISSRSFHDSIPCYVFSCMVKPGAGSYPVLKYLNTWFDRRTFNIVYRDYHYEYSGLLFSFDVTIKIKMDYKYDLLYPDEIKYSGYWDIPFHKQETTDFNLNFRLRD